MMIGPPPTNSTSSSQLPRPPLTLISPLQGTSAQSANHSTPQSISVCPSAPPLQHLRCRTIQLPFPSESVRCRPAQTRVTQPVHSHTQEWSQQSNSVYPQPAASADAFITDLITQYPTLDTRDGHPSQPAEYITPSLAVTPVSDTTLPSHISPGWGNRRPALARPIPPPVLSSYLQGERKRPSQNASVNTLKPMTMTMKK
jgi:hypothetical protein